ncbi:hypothetical protein IFM89_035246, partial [Coptis chinensis]
MSGEFSYGNAWLELCLQQTALLLIAIVDNACYQEIQKVHSSFQPLFMDINEICSQ